MDFVDRFQSLLTLGETCKSRLYFLKSQLESFSKGQRDERPDCLVNTDLLKIRQKLTKSFPILPDITKTQGYDALLIQARDISTKLTTFRSLVDDIVTFSEASKDLLLTVASTILDFRMERNRNISLYFFDLLVCQMKVMWIFSTLDDKKVLFSLAEITYEIMRSADTTFNPAKVINQSTQKITKIIADLDNIHVSFIHSYWQLSSLIRPMLLQFKDSIDFAEDCNALREKCVLNSLSEGSDKLGRYATGMISPTISLSKYTELCDVDKYREYVIFSCFSCPSIISDNDILNLMKLVCKGTLFVGIFRDMVFNVHIELEVLSLVFPLQDASSIVQEAAAASPSSKGLTLVSPTIASAAVTYPSGFKLKKILKELSRITISTAGPRHRERRSFILEELCSLNYILNTFPGLVGPRLPQLFAAAAFAKSEILHYFRIAQFLSTKTVRRDTRKYLEIKEFDGDDIVLLLAELRKLITSITKHSDIIHGYYSEFLLQLDSKAIKSLLLKNSAIYDMYKTQFDTIVAALDSFTTAATASSSSQKAGSIDIDRPLHVLRSSWDTITSVIYSQNIGLISKGMPSFQELSLRMLGVHERSRYIDVLDELIGEYMEPYDIWWYKEVLIDRFLEAMKSNTRQSLKSSATLTFLPGVKYSLSSTNMVESDRIKLSIEFYMDDRMNDMSVYLASLMKLYWFHLQALENQVTQIEAARRIEKLIQYKNTKQAESRDPSFSNDANAEDSAQVDDSNKNVINNTNNSNVHNASTNNGIETLPGAESEIWAKQTIEKLVDIHQRIVNTMLMANELGIIRIFSREYDIGTFLRLYIISYVENQLIDLFSQASSSNNAGNVTYATNTDMKTGKDTINSSGSIPSVYTMFGPKVLLTKFKSLLHVAQVALGCIDCHISSSLRVLLFKECCDLSIPPPGVPPTFIGLNTTTTNNNDNNNNNNTNPDLPSLGDSIPATAVEHQGNLLWKVVDWFTKLCHQIVSSDTMSASSNSSMETLVWAPYINAIIRPTKITSQSIASLSKGRGSMTAFFHSQAINSSVCGVSLDSIALESYLSRQDLGCICQIIGVQGVRILDQEILNSIIEKLTIIKDILFKHQQELTEVYDDILKSFDIYRKLQDKFSFALTALKDIGMFLVIRDILHAALGDTLEVYSPSLISTTRTASNMVHPYGNRKLISPLNYLAYDCGNLSSSDIALANALSPHLFRSSDRGYLSLLPVLGSMLFLDDSWKKSQYVLQYDCFANNEHVVTFALSKLFLCSFGKETISELDTSLLLSSSSRTKPTQVSTKAGLSLLSSSSSSSSSLSSSSRFQDPMIMLPSIALLPTSYQKPKNTTNRISIAEYDMKFHTQIYLIMSTQILYMMKSHVLYNKTFPIYSMFTVLEHYVRWSPLIDYSEFNRLVPNTMLHTIRMDSVIPVATEPKRGIGRSNSIASQVSSVNEKY